MHTGGNVDQVRAELAKARKGAALHDPERLASCPTLIRLAASIRRRRPTDDADPLVDAKDVLEEAAQTLASDLRRIFNMMFAIGGAIPRRTLQNRRVTLAKARGEHVTTIRRQEERVLTIIASTIVEREQATRARPLRVFYAYAHVDANYHRQLEIRLAVLRRQELIEEWHDRKVGAGKEWMNEIDEQLETADIILLLVSPDFLASDYCYEKELGRALERHNSGQARVIPIILRHSYWQETPIGHLQALPPDGKPIAGRGDRAWLEVTIGLREVIKEIQGR